MLANWEYLRIKIHGRELYHEISLKQHSILYSFDKNSSETGHRGLLSMNEDLNRPLSYKNNSQKEASPFSPKSFVSRKMFELACVT